MTGAAIIDDLRARGLLHDSTDEAELRALLDAGPVVLYHGIDPSASSLHVGNLVGVLVMRRFQDFGHRPLALIGGATGMIGDPSGRSDERNLLDDAALQENLAGIRGQLERLMDFSGDAAATMVNNYDWTKDVTFLEFLRDVGKHVTVNQMVAKDSVKSRMEGEHGISFTEFSYMLLQAFDFWVQHEHYGCMLQIGGSDQWGNITAGIDLTRKRSGTTVHGLTWPLITRSDGQKFGKSVDGAVWLAPERTLPYEFHQYWMRTDDRDVERFLLQLTLLSLDRIAEVMAEHGEAPERRHAQRVLADEVTGLIHGPDEVRRANLAAGALFGGAELDGDALDALRGIVPETTIEPSVLAGDEPVIDLLVVTGVCSSKGDARRTLGQGGIRLNGDRVGDAAAAIAPVDGRFVLVQKGKKQRHLAVVQA
ncbi:MAG: tyrosine--tRNA ligase [Actinomycetota bacterium]